MALILSLAIAVLLIFLVVRARPGDRRGANRNGRGSDGGASFPFFGGGDGGGGGHHGHHGGGDSGGGDSGGGGFDGGGGGDSGGGGD